MPAWAIGLAAGAAAVLAGALCYGCIIMGRAIDGVSAALEDLDNPWDELD